MIIYLINLPRLVKQIILFVVDSFLLILILLSSFAIRNGFWSIPHNEGESLNIFIFCVPFIAIPIFIKFGLYRAIIRYIGFQALWQILKAISLYALIIGLILFMTSIKGFPRSVLIINWLLAIMAIGGSRLFSMWLINKFQRNSNLLYKNVLIYGAGSAGRELSIALKYSNEFNPVALIDDDHSYQGRSLGGLEVLSPLKLAILIQEKNISEIFLAIPSLTRKRRSEIMTFLSHLPVQIRSLPGVSELARGKVNISDLTEISIKDLLGRTSVVADKDLLAHNISNKVVLVTGAGGSIGSELCRQIIYLNAKILILYELSEFALYKINSELSKLDLSNLKIYPILGSVQNKNRFSKVVNLFKVDTIYHSAAYKHVPMVELNNTEGVKNNIFGTLNCAEVAIEEGVKTFVLISTDKAVRPTNTMGATKRFAEQLLQGIANSQNQTQFSIVRFGNVLGSSGSVIPLFKKQIREGGPITVTDANMTRYFMLITEAVELVIQAGAMASSGDVFVLDMGQPISIDALARKMIDLSGLQYGDGNQPNDITIEYTGIRPGEKLFEELLIGDNVSKTSHPMIMRAKEAFIDLSTLKLILINLDSAIINNDSKLIRKLLVEAVPEFNPQSGIEDLLYSKDVKN